MERGNATGASDAVLEALADALRLDDAERAHLFDLARAASPNAPRRRRGLVQQRIRPAVQRILDSIASPATVSNMHCDYLAANQLGRALYAPLFEAREQPPNSARFTFLDPAAYSRSDEALNLLASWVATPEHEPAAPARNDVPRR
jgi:MmyB-like transcription regulator ligand binding domain